MAAQPNGGFAMGKPWENHGNGRKTWENHWENHLMSENRVPLSPRVNHNLLLFRWRVYLQVSQEKPFPVVLNTRLLNAAIKRALVQFDPNTKPCIEGGLV